MDVLEKTLRNADTLLVPAFPLEHPDHLRPAELVLEAACFARRIGLYVEQPYALWEDGVGLPSQLALIPHRVVWPMSRYEMVSGDVVALLEPR